MKTKQLFLRTIIILIFSAGSLGVWAQNQNPTQSVCVSNQPYYVDTISGATYVWSITGGISTDYQINGTGNQISVDWYNQGSYVLSVYSIVLGCSSSVQSVAVTTVIQPIGPSINVKSPNLTNVCIGTDVSATFIAGSGGVGCSDTFEYRFDSGTWITYTSGSNLSTTGHTFVEIRGQRTGCTSGAGCIGTSWITLASWIITPMPTAAISYSGSPWCTSASAQSVSLIGTTGGIYSASPAGLTIDSITGEILPATSNSGTYTVTYTIAAAGGCSVVTATDTVTITTMPNASISYSGSPWCSSASVQSVTITGTTGGVFSSSPAGLSINATTGEITPGTSTAGTYTVTYTIAPVGGCAVVTATASVTITALATATISYSGSPWCSSSPAQSVTLTGTTGGVFTAVPSGLDINATTGEIIPGTSTAGTYTVTYTIAPVGGCAVVTATASVTINATPSTSAIWHN